MKEGTSNPVSDRQAERLSGMWLTPKDVGLLLQVHPKTVIHYCETKRIPAKKFGSKWRIPKVQFDALQFPDETEKST